MNPDTFDHHGRLKVEADRWTSAGRQIAGALAEAGIARIEHVRENRPEESSTLFARRTDLPALLEPRAGRLAWPGGHVAWADGWIEWSVADPALHRALQAINASGPR